MREEAEARERMSDTIADLRAENERLRALVDPELTFKDLEMKIRDGTLDFHLVLGEGSQPAVKFLAALMLNFLLGDGDEPVEPPNYQSTEITIRPAGGVEEIRCSMEVIKDGGRSSHQIRRDLEAVLRQLEQWDMLTLDAEGHGVATADAPWARKLIADALA